VPIEVAKYKEEVERISKADTSLESNLHLKNAMSAMPLLQEQKRLMDMHMILAFALVERVTKRHIDQFFMFEENIQKQVNDINESIYSRILPH